MTRIALGRVQTGGGSGLRARTVWFAPAGSIVNIPLAPNKLMAIAAELIVPPSVPE